MTVFPYATQQQGWSDFADDLLTMSAGIDPGVLLRGQSGGKISEAIDDLYTLQRGVEALSDSAAEMSAVCGVQDGYDVDLANCPATRERVEAAAQFAKDMRVMMRSGQVEPEQVIKADEVADELAAQRKAAIERHAGETSTTVFPEVPSCEMPDAHYPGGTHASDGNSDGDFSGGDENSDGDFSGGDETPPEEPGDQPQNPFEPERPPMQAPMNPEPARGKYMTPMDDGVVNLPETVEPQTQLSRGDSAVVSPSSSVLGQQVPQPTTQQAWQSPQYSGITQPQGRMLGQVNPQKSPQQRRERREPEWNRPVSAETLAAIPVSHAVASTMPSAPSPTVSPTTPGTHMSAATVPAAPTSPGGQTPGGVGPTPMTTVGPGARTSLQGGGMREKPSIPDNLKAVLSADVVRELEQSFDTLFPDPDKPNADPIPAPTGALR